jgi:hypothetical protein
MCLVEMQGSSVLARGVSTGFLSLYNEQHWDLCRVVPRFYICRARTRSYISRLADGVSISLPLPCRLVIFDSSDNCVSLIMSTYVRCDF